MRDRDDLERLARRGYEAALELGAEPVSAERLLRNALVLTFHVAEPLASELAREARREHERAEVVVAP